MKEEIEKPNPQEWPLAELVKQTGITPGQVQQASREGFVASGPGRRYAVGRTLVGLIKFLLSRINKLPVYDNVDQCAEATGIPASVIKSVRRVCPDAFRHYHVHLGPLLKAIFAQRDEKDWRALKEQYEAQTAKLNYERASGEHLDKAKVGTAIRRAFSSLWFNMERAAELDLPPQLKGCDEGEIKARLVETNKRLRSGLMEHLGQWTNNGNGKHE